MLTHRMQSLLLACLVYARRPLRLEELSEAKAAANIENGKAINDQGLFKSTIVRLCEPLVQVQEMEGVSQLTFVCSLAHSSVRKFLLANPDVLGSNDLEQPSLYRITEEVMAKICLKYLGQPSYRKPLVKKEDTYYDVKNRDILNHHLLPYAAKYWDKHLDGVAGHNGLSGCEDPTSFCYQVMQFISSSQFLACLQVQSLLIDGIVFHSTFLYLQKGKPKY